jgi:hypothetical protein
MVSITNNDKGFGGVLLEMGDHDISATGIQIRFAYPYNATHSSKFALSLPNHFNVPHSATGTKAVYP